MPRLYRRISPTHYQTSSSVNNLEAQFRSLEILNESAAGLVEALHWGFIMGIKMA
jgi:hypothetical protein